VFVFGLNWLWSHLAIRSFLRRIGKEAMTSVGEPRPSDSTT
jgi:hypothetical protein